MAIPPPPSKISWSRAYHFTAAGALHDRASPFSEGREVPPPRVPEPAKWIAEDRRRGEIALTYSLSAGPSGRYGLVKESALGDLPAQERG